MFEDVAVADALGAVRSHVFDAHDDPWGSDRIDAIAVLDRVIRSAQAEQAHQIAALAAERSARLITSHADLSVIGEVGMARNVSPAAAGNQFGFALGLARLPRVHEVFAAGLISEPAARNVVNETVGLDNNQAHHFDTRIAAVLAGLTPGKARDTARTLAISIDPDAALERSRRNRANQFVSLFPGTDGTALLQLRGPAEDLLACHQSLTAAAKTAKAAGDPRSKGQVMCQHAIARLTGQASPDIPIELGIHMSLASLLRHDQTPALLSGHGPIPAELAHQLIATHTTAWVRRFFTDPVTGIPVDVDTRRRRFEAKTKQLITATDQTCRQPGCDSRIADLDHIQAHATGGPSTRSNAQGLCKRSHTLKHLPGWTISGTNQDTTWTTPTGHHYHSPQPRILGHLRQ